MGTIVESTAVTTPSLRHPKGHATELAERAARQCLDEAGVRPDEVDLLINAGIYRENHLGEPALAAIIQHDLGLNAELQPHAGRHGTFSFDILNGACGALTALQLADTLMRAGTIRCALIVAEDTRPDRDSEFPFTPAGAAVLLGWSDPVPGLVGHRMDTIPDSRDAFTSTLQWRPVPHLPGRPSGRNTLTIERDETFEALAGRAAAAALEDYLVAASVTLGSADCLVVSGLSDPEVLRGPAVGECSVVGVPDELGAVHTAGPLAALHAAGAAGHLGRARNVVLVAVAAGLTVGITHYRPS